MLIVCTTCTIQFQTTDGAPEKFVLQRFDTAPLYCVINKCETRASDKLEKCVYSVVLWCSVCQICTEQTCAPYDIHRRWNSPSWKDNGLQVVPIVTIRCVSTWWLRVVFLLVFFWIDSETFVGWWWGCIECVPVQNGKVELSGHSSVRWKRSIYFPFWFGNVLDNFGATRISVFFALFCVYKEC